MIGNGLLKFFITAHFEVFLKITRVDNKKDFLALIKREEKLKKILQHHKIKTNYNIIFRYRSDLQLKML